MVLSTLALSARLIGAFLHHISIICELVTTVGIFFHSLWEKAAPWTFFEVGHDNIIFREVRELHVNHYSFFKLYFP